MKLYDFGPAANAQRVRVFLAEKGLQLPTVEVNVREGQLYEAPYAAMNPFHCVPFLELDDGRVIAESVSICRYLEELHPEPPLFGRDPRRAGRPWTCGTGASSLTASCRACTRCATCCRSSPAAWCPARATTCLSCRSWSRAGKAMLEIFLGRLEPQLEGQDFIAGPALSIADITGFFTVRMAAPLEIDLAGRYPNIARWQAALAARPSVAGL